MDCHAGVALNRGRAETGSLRLLAVLSVVVTMLWPSSAAAAAQAPTSGVFLTSYASLPDAPGRVAATLQAPAQEFYASISGVVLDINEGLVPEAAITLKEEGQPDRTATSGQNGRFSFTGLTAGKYRVIIHAPGLEGFESPEIELHTAERHELQKIALPIATNSVDVQVTVTQVEIAQEQLKMEEKQRVFGVLPNFYTSYIWNPAPLDSRQKFNLAFHSIFDPADFVVTGIVAGVQQAGNTFPGYGQGAAGYGKRYAASFGDGAIARLLGSAIFPSILHQDPRYFYQGSGGKKSRAIHAIVSAVVCRKDDGESQFAYAKIAGSFAGGAISNAYHPSSSRGVRLTIVNGLIDTAGNALNNLIREFALRSVTPGVPSFAAGKPAP